MENPGIWFGCICRKNGLFVTDAQIKLFERYVTLLLEWNRKINLISRKDEDQIWSNHILHSASILFKLSLRPGERILDLGTGGGLPGIPLKILLPSTQFVLLDATHKKIAAVQEIIQSLGLHGVEALWGRAEDIAKERNLVSQFGYIVARGVAPLKDLIKWSLPFAHLGAQQKTEPDISGAVVPPPAIIALKGGDLEKEIEEAKRRTPVRGIEIVNLAFQGSEEISVTDKKIVIAKL